jgi:Fibronectin type III domain
MTLPLERNPSTNAQNPISMSQINVELFFTANTPISLNQITVRNLLQKPTDLSTISLWDGFGKSNIGKPKNPVFTLITQTTATVSWGASDGICNKYTITVKDAATDTIVYGPVQNFTTLPLALTANLTGLVAATTFKVHLLASNTAVTPLPTAETVVTLLTLENIPLTPAAPTVTVIDKNTLRVTGTATYASSYDIYEVIASVDTLIITNVQMPYDHTVLTYSLHTYKIKGRSTGGVGPISPASTATRSLPDFPIAATNLSYGALTNITSSSVAMTWTISTSPVIINQRVRFALHANGTEQYNSGLLANNVTGQTSTATLNPATLYDVYVDTINEAGTAVSTALAVTTKTAQPIAPTASATSQTSITVTWGTTFGATSYVVYKDGVSQGTQTSPFISNTGITSYTSHSYQIAAVNLGGESVKSPTTTEVSYPDLPVTVTNIVVTPDMNSFSVSWTLATTTSTRTVDSYRVYGYLKSDMSQVYDSGVLVNSVTNTVVGTSLIGWTDYVIRIYTFNRAGSVFVDTNSTTLADRNPDPLTASLTTVTNQELLAVVQGSPVTIGLFTPNYNSPGISITTSTGQFQAGTSVLTTGWVTSATIVPDSSGNIVFQPRMTASPNETTTVSSTFSIGLTGSRTFSVTTRNPNVPTILSATGSYGTATITWTNLAYTYIVTSDDGKSKTVTNVGTVTLGDTPATRLTGGLRTFTVIARNSLNGSSAPASTSAVVIAMPLFSYTRSGATVTETAGSNTGTFGISTTNVSGGSSYNWSITGTGITAADFSAMSYTTTGGSYTSMTPALTGLFIVNSGSATLSFTIATDHLTESVETMSFQLTGSPTGDFATTNTTMSITDTSLDPVLYPSPVWTPAVRYNQPIGQPSITSSSVGGLEPSWPINVSATSGTILASPMSSYAASGQGTTDGSGNLSVSISLTASGSYKTSTSMTFSVGTWTGGTWTIWSVANETLSVTSAVNQGGIITLSISGGYANDTYTISRASSGTGTISNASSVTFGSLNASGTGSSSVATSSSEWGPCTFSVTFGTSTSIKTSNTLTVRPNETVMVSYSSVNALMTVSLGNGVYSDSWTATATGTNTMSTFQTSFSGTLSAAGTYGTSFAVNSSRYGNWYIDVTFTSTGHTVRSNTNQVVPKSAPNVTPVIGSITAGLNSLTIPFTISSSTAGPIEGVVIVGSGISGSTTSISGGAGTITASGLSTYTTYTFGLAAYNTDAQGSTSSTVSPTTLPDIYPDTFPAITSVTGANPSTAYYPASQAISGMSAFCPVTVSWSLSGFGTSTASATVSGSGTVTSSGSPTTLNATTDSTGSIYVAFGLYSPANFSSTGTLSLTVGSRTLSSAYTLSTRAAVIAPTFTQPSSVINQPRGTPISASFTVTGLEPNYNAIAISASGGTIAAGYDSGHMSSFTSSTVYVTTSGVGSLYVTIQFTTSSSYNTNTSMSYSIGSGSGYTWSALTTPNEQASVTTSVNVGNNATISISGGYGYDSYTVSRVSSTGNISNASNITSGNLDSSGSASITAAATHAGTCQFSITFGSSGHTITTGTLTVYPNESVSITPATGLSGGSSYTISITGGLPGTTFTTSATSGNTYNGINLFSPPYTLDSSGNYSFAMTAGAANYGTLSFAFTFAFSSHTVTSNVVTIAKAAPNSIPVINSVVAGNASFTVTFTVPASTTGPVEGAAIYLPGTGYGASATWKTPIAGSGSGTITVNSGLTNGQSYSFGVHTYNSDAANPYTSLQTSVTPTAPTAPGAPTLSSVNGTSTWTVTATDPSSTGTVGGVAATITSYNMYVNGSAASTASTIAGLSVTASPAVGTTVYITCINSGGLESPASATATTPATTTITVSSNDSTNLVLNYSPTSNPAPTPAATSVDVLVTNPDSSTYQVNLASGSSTTMPWPAIGVTPNVSVTVQHRRVNRLGPGAWSSGITVVWAVFVATTFTATTTAKTDLRTFSYTAPVARTYTVTATGYDCRMSLNGGAYQDSDNATGKGERMTIALTAGASLTINVLGSATPGTGGNGGFGSLTVNIT